MLQPRCVNRQGDMGFIPPFWLFIKKAALVLCLTAGSPQRINESHSQAGKSLERKK